MKATVVPAIEAHIGELGANMREADQLEIIGMGSTVAEALRISWRESLMTKTALVDGAVAGVWGVAGSLAGGTGQPWLLTTPLFARIPRLMVQHGRTETRAWLRIFDRLENCVDATYYKACNFLAVIGFQLDPPHLLPNGMPVRRFWMER